MPSTKIAQMVLLHPNKTAARAQDKKYLQTTSPEPLVQIQNIFTEMFLMMPITTIALNIMVTSAKIEISLND